MVTTAIIAQGKEFTLSEKKSTDGTRIEFQKGLCVCRVISLNEKSFHCSICNTPFEPLIQLKIKYSELFGKLCHTNNSLKRARIHIDEIDSRERELNGRLEQLEGSLREKNHSIEFLKKELGKAKEALNIEHGLRVDLEVSRNSMRDELADLSASVLDTAQGIIEDKISEMEKNSETLNRKFHELWLKYIKLGELVKDDPRIPPALLNIEDSEQVSKSFVDSESNVAQ